MASEKMNRMNRGYQSWRDEGVVPPPPTSTTTTTQPGRVGGPEEEDFRRQSAIMRQIQSGAIDFSKPRTEPKAADRPARSIEEQLMDLETMQTFEQDPIKKNKLLNQFQKLKKELGR